MESAVKQRLIAFIQFLGLSKNAFENACGLSTRYVSNISSSVSSAKLKQISLKFPQLNTTWLLTGEGEMLKPTGGHVTQNNVNGNNNYNSGFQLVPASGDAEDACPKCGNVTAYLKIPDRIIYAPETNVSEWVESNPDACERIDFTRILDPRVLKVQKINTRAMEPWISEGAFLFTRLIPQWRRLLFDGTIYGIDLDYPHMIVRRVYDDGENIKCVPMNADYAPIVVPRERVLGVYEIVASLKMMKKTL